ncbi:MAG: hypothetical protein H6Q25_731 [Bacteroidetes bacterium]|nr:hypothetical protein [Bacteroidota bacterium]
MSIRAHEHMSIRAFEYSSIRAHEHTILPFQNIMEFLQTKIILKYTDTLIIITQI